MKDSREERILEILGKSKEALTFGEVLAEYCGTEPYFASLSTNVYLSSLDESKLNLFFDDALENAEKVYNCYINLLPCMNNLEKNSLIHYVGDAEKKKYETHTNFVSDSQDKMMKRIGREIERKKNISPTLISITQEVAKAVSETYREPHSAVLSGSGSIKNNRPFIYYGDSNEIKSVSDIDIIIFSLNKFSLRNLNPTFDEISRRRKVVLNPVVRYFRNTGEDISIMRSGIPIIV